jgi:hypothetical protein
MLQIEFAGEIWCWRGPAPYHFITVPNDGCNCVTWHRS